VFHASDDADTLDLIWRCDEEARKRMCEVRDFYVVIDIATSSLY